MARSYDLTSGSISQHLLRLAAPLIMGNILQQLYNTADAFILGRFGGALEFAAVGVAGSVMNLFLFMITGACTGISVILAQLYGAGDRAAFRREHWLSLSAGALATIVFSGLGLLLLRAIGRANAALFALASAVTVNLALDYWLAAKLHWGITGAAYENACGYMKLVALFYTLCFTGNTFAGYFDGIGRVSIPFIGATSHIALRVVLSWLLVKRMGLPAVALATGLGWLLVNILWAVIKRRSADAAAQNYQ